MNAPIKIPRPPPVKTLKSKPTPAGCAGVTKVNVESSIKTIAEPLTPFMAAEIESE